MSRATNNQPAETQRRGRMPELWRIHNLLLNEFFARRPLRAAFVRDIKLGILQKVDFLGKINFTRGKSAKTGHWTSRTVRLSLERYLEEGPCNSLIRCHSTKVLPWHCLLSGCCTSCYEPLNVNNILNNRLSLNKRLKTWIPFNFATHYIMYVLS